MERWFDVREVGNTYALARTGQHLSQSEVARRTGMGQAAISRFENGRGNVTVSNLDRLAEGMGLKLEVRLVPRWA